MENTSNFARATDIIRQYPCLLVHSAHSPARSHCSHRLSLRLLFGYASPIRFAHIASRLFFCSATPRLFALLTSPLDYILLGYASPVQLQLTSPLAHIIAQLYRASSFSTRFYEAREPLD